MRYKSVRTVTVINATHSGEELKNVTKNGEKKVKTPV